MAATMNACAENSTKISESSVPAVQTDESKSCHQGAAVSNSNDTVTPQVEPAVTFQKESTSLDEQVVKKSASVPPETESSLQDSSETQELVIDKDDSEKESTENDESTNIEQEIVEATENADDRVGSDREATPDSEDLSPREPSPVDIVINTNEQNNKSEVVVTKTKEGKSKKKEDKSIEHILKALNSLQTSEEKLAALCKKYTDLLDEHRLFQSKFKQNQRKLTVILREKEQLQSEHSKAVLAKSKLESLCRELQRHNKLVKEESLARAREEEEKRKEVTAKFQATITDIQAQMNDHYAKNGKLREENIELANRLKNLIEQYELREKHIEKVLKHKELETQLSDAKLAQASLQMTEEMEKNIREKQLLMSQATEQDRKIQMLEGQETQLKAQVALYTEKYEEFQSTLAKSNSVFQNFKTEMDKMTKKIKKLEKETSLWRTRWENCNKALLDMAEEKTKADKESLMQQAKIARLEKLCRALQAERHKSPGPAGTGAEGADGVEGLEESLETDLPPAPENPNMASLKVAREIEPTKTPPNTPSESAENPTSDPQQSVIQAASGQLAATAANQSQEALQNGDVSEPASQSGEVIKEPSASSAGEVEAASK